MIALTFILLIAFFMGFGIAAWGYSTIEREIILHEVCELLDLPYDETELNKRLRIRKIEKE